jgi:luciferase family oxidoreductase group 1
MIPFSVLDLSPIVEGGTPAAALANTLDLARHAERLGFRRYWLAEHHNMAGIASAATAVVIAHVAAGTATIRVGSGGIMLPNHAPLVIAEQFGTLESLHPGRIDLGLGRAPGTDMATARALRRDLDAAAERFPQDVLELQAYLEEPQPGQRIRAIPGSGLRVPIWLLGSSLFSAQLAAILGLPFAFASHFAPDALLDALAIYRERFEPSKTLDRPYAMPAVHIAAADSDGEARRLFTSIQQSFARLRRGEPGQLPPPVDDLAGVLAPMEVAGVGHAFRYAFVGAEATVRQGVAAFLELTCADELMVSVHLFDHAARRRSLEITAAVRDSLPGPAPGPSAGAAP